MRTALAALLIASLAWMARADDAPPGPPAPGGRVEASVIMYDAGNVDRGVIVRHEFLLKNVGTGQLSVDAKPG